jgi:hypothetical protein
MTIKTPARVALLAALAAFTIWGVASSSGAPVTSHHHGGAKGKAGHGLAGKLARARIATAQYAFDLDAAKTAGYKQITPVMHNMGLHYLNPDITKFDVTKPPILVYSRRDGKYQLGALEWVFPKKPKEAPLKGAKYGSFPAACHYDDGTFVTADSEADCKPKNQNGSPFFFWHPDLVTLHVWLWYPNPDGLYASMNPFVAPFNGG